MRHADLIVSQIEMMAKTANDIKKFANEYGPDGWDLNELETVDSMTNTLIKQCWGVLTSIGGPLKELRQKQ